MSGLGPGSVALSRSVKPLNPHPPPRPPPAHPRWLEATEFLHHPSIIHSIQSDSGRLWQCTHDMLTCVCSMSMTSAVEERVHANESSVIVPIELDPHLVPYGQATDGSQPTFQCLGVARKDVGAEGVDPYQIRSFTHLKA